VVFFTCEIKILSTKLELCGVARILKKLVRTGSPSLNKGERRLEGRAEAR
jgi:hypothetical protein